jgi:hypothetical protein
MDQRSSTEDDWNARPPCTNVHCLDDSIRPDPACTQPYCAQDAVVRETYHLVMTVRLVIC